MDQAVAIAKFVLLACHIVITIKAFQDEIVEGALVLLVPFYLLYYGFRKMTGAGKDLFLWIYILAGATIVVGVFFPGGFGTPRVAKLVTTEFAQELLEEPAADPVCESSDTRMGKADICQFKAKSGARKDFGIIWIAKCSGLTENMRSGMAISDLKEVADEAYSSRDNIYVRKGESCLLIATQGVPDNIRVYLARQKLARAILAGMK
jgi:hypothetical protein